MKKYFPSSELIINEDGSVFHLHVKPEWLADKVILVGDPGRVALVASHFENKECEVESREFKTITGTYKGKRITVVSTGIGCDNIDIVMNELDALANIDFETREEKRTVPAVRVSTYRYVRRFTAKYTGGNIRMFAEVYRFRRIIEFLCRTQCCMRLGFRTCFPQPHGVVGKYVCSCALCY